MVDAAAARLTEDELLAEVTGKCDHLGLPWHHHPDSRRAKGSPGFPDLVVAGRTAVLFAELKSETGDTSADQDLWLWHLDRAAALIAVLRPSDLASGFIDRLLETIT